MLPSVYEMEDYNKCLRNGDEYFKATVDLRPNNSENAVWKIIEERKKLRHLYYDRSTVYRWICVPKENATNLSSTRQYLDENLFVKFNNVGLVPHVKEVYHFDHKNHTIDYHIWAVMLVFCYIGFVIFATYRTLKPNAKANEWIDAFSLKKNWKILTSLKTGGDSGRLRSFQSIRAITSVVVAFCHMCIVTLNMITADFDAFEYLFQYEWLVALAASNFFLVQLFFLMSAFLLANQICGIHEKNGKLTLWNCWCLLINRLFRFWPTLITVRWLIMSHKFYMPQMTELMEFAEIGCGQHGTEMLLFYHNWLPWKQMCHPGTWYISADTQLYVVALLTLYAILKLKLNMKKALWNLTIFSVLMHAAIRYYYKLDAMVLLGPEFFMRAKFFNDRRYILQYTAPTSIWTTTLLGTLLGYTYFHLKTTEITLSKWTRRLIVAFSVFLQIAPMALVVALRTRPLSSQILVSFIGSLVKPIYAIGCGVFILAASLGNLPSNIQKFLEKDRLAVAGNFAFGMYVWHFFPAFLKGAFTEGLFRFELIDTALYVAWVMCAGAILAVFFALFLEQPGLNLQKKILPQVATRREKRQ